MSTDIGDVYNALQAAWAALLESENVKVFSGPPGPEETGTEFVHFGDAELEEKPEASGGNREETWKVAGEIAISSVAWKGSTELTIRAARDRAQEILDVLRTYVNDTYTGSYPDVEFTGGAIVQNFDAKGRQCGRRFELTVKFPTNP